MLRSGLAMRGGNEVWIVRIAYSREFHLFRSGENSVSAVQSCNMFRLIDGFPQTIATKRINFGLQFGSLVTYWQEFHPFRSGKNRFCCSKPQHLQRSIRISANNCHESNQFGSPNRKLAPVNTSMYSGKAIFVHSMLRLQNIRLKREILKASNLHINCQKL